MTETFEVWRTLLGGGILLIVFLAGGAWVRLGRTERDLRRVEGIVVVIRDALIAAGIIKAGKGG